MSRSVAIALGYHPDADLAPQVLAAGAGDVAERIRRVAERHGIPFEEDPDLAERLFSVDVGEEIPEDLFVVVARVFAYLDHIARAMGEEPVGGGVAGYAPTEGTPPTTRSPAT